MTASTPINVYEQAGREKKAGAIAREIIRRLPSVLRELQEDSGWWAEVAKDAGVNEPSAETIQAVIAIFEEKAEKVGDK
jgi:hypothetical protein